MKFIFFAAWVLFAFSANAQDKMSACDYVARYIPSPDTNYQSGVDVNGNAVAPADLPGSSHLKIPNHIQIYITPDVNQFLNIPGNPSYLPNAAIGVIDANQNGALSFNGQPISPEAQSNLVAYCQHKNSAPPPKKDLLKGQ